MDAKDLDMLGELGEEFFARDPREVAPGLLGAVLVCRKGGATVAGRIVEAEAYLGADDPGSHASTKGITLRNAVMYGPPGHLYVYFTYGSHHMLNIVCEPHETAGAVLIRALEPLLGIEEMRHRRGKKSLLELCNGPGKLAEALGLDLSDNGSRLGRGPVRILAGSPVTERVAVSGRVGLSVGHELHLRYFLEGNTHVSKGRTGPARSRRRTETGRDGPK
ncbi:MAG: DNA-3-methyladenine glycosylase [Coriobacteriia bacterium]|nr:DNA-3-methyladenine glycosylase [Coriobacteriia bacterium]